MGLTEGRIRHMQKGLNTTVRPTQPPPAPTRTKENNHMKDFLMKLADLTDEHKVAIYSEKVGGDSQVVFQNYMVLGNELETGREHLTAYELRKITKRKCHE